MMTHIVWVILDWWVIKVEIIELCPTSHPFVYLDGAYCCSSPRDKAGVTLVKASRSCEGNGYTQCPSSSGCDSRPNGMTHILLI